MHYDKSQNPQQKGPGPSRHCGGDPGEGLHQTLIAGSHLRAAPPTGSNSQAILTAINRSFGCLNFSAPSAKASSGVAASTVPSHLAGVPVR
jgi:hypothetical protein